MTQAAVASLDCPAPAELDEPKVGAPQASSGRARPDVNVVDSHT